MEEEYKEVYSCLEQYALYYQNLQALYNKNQDEIARLNMTISTPTSGIDEQIKTYTDIITKERDAILEMCKEGKKYLMSKSFPSDVQIDPYCQAAQYILNCEWKKAEDQKKIREEKLKECRELNNKILLYNEQIQPLEVQTIKNITNIMNSNRYLKRKLLRLEAEDLANSADFLGRYLSISARAASEENRSISLSGHLVVNEAKVRGLYLKHALLTCPPAEQGIIADQIKNHMQQINQLFPELPNFQATQQTYQVLDASLSADREKIIDGIRTTISSYKSFDRTYAGSLGVHDKAQQGIEELTYKFKMSKLENDGMANELKETKDRIQSKKENIENLSGRLANLQNEINNMKLIVATDDVTIHQNIAKEQRRKADIERKRNGNVNLIEVCNGFIGPMIEFEQKANVSSEFRENLNQLQETIQKFNQNQRKYEFEQMRKTKNLDCIEFAKKLGNGKFSNADLIKFFDKEHLILSADLSNLNILYVKLGSPSYLTEMILNPFNEDPVFNDIMIALLTVSNGVDIKEHMRSLMSFCDAASKNEFDHINFEDRNTNQFIPRPFPPPFFDTVKSENINDKFISYVAEWIKLYPSGILGYRDLVRSLYDFMRKCKGSQGTPNEIIRTLKNVSEQGYQSGSAKLTRLELPEKSDDVKIISNYFITQLWENYMDLTLKDCLEYYQQMCSDPDKLTDSRNSIKIPPPMNKRFQGLHITKKNLTSCILTQIYYDKKGDAALEWIKVTLEAFNNDNYEFYSIVYRIFDKISKVIPTYKNQDLSSYFEKLRSTKDGLKDRQKSEKKLPYHKDFMQTLAENLQKIQINQMTEIERLRIIIRIIVIFLKPQQVAAPTIYKVDKKKFDKIYNSITSKEVIETEAMFLKKKGL